MKRILRYCILMIPGAAAAQPAGGATGWIRLAEPPPAAVLVVGERIVGDASDVVALPAGPTTIALIEAGERAWDPRRAEVEVDVVAGDTATVYLRLPIRYRLSTLPSGAEVALVGPDGTREVLGTSPLVVDRDVPLAGVLVATRAGYRDAGAAPGDSAVNHVVLTLEPLTAEEGAAVDWRPPGRARTWIDIAAAGAVLAGAGVAIRYKFLADAVDDRYRAAGSPERGDPALRVEAQRLDRISAGALGFMQVGLGVLAIRLVLR